MSNVITGNVVGIPNPVSDWAQTDPNMADYIKNKPTIVSGVNGKNGDVHLTAQDVGAISENDLQVAVNQALAQAKASGEFDGKDGERGEKGDKGDSGKDGYTPVKNVDYFDGKDGAPGKDGQPGADGKTPVKGEDYYTEADKAEIVSAVIAQLPVYNGEVVE